MTFEKWYESVATEHDKTWDCYGTIKTKMKMAWDAKEEQNAKKIKNLVEALRHYANRMGDGGPARQVLEKHGY